MNFPEQELLLDEGGISYQATDAWGGVVAPSSELNFHVSDTGDYESHLASAVGDIQEDPFWVCIFRVLDYDTDSESIQYSLMFWAFSLSILGLRLIRP
jgi:hypothetical protein